MSSSAVTSDILLKIKSEEEPYLINGLMNEIEHEDCDITLSSPPMSPDILMRIKAEEEPYVIDCLKNEGRDRDNSSSTCRSRKPNFQEDEKEKLIRLVLPLEEILYPAGPRRGNIESRTEAWRSVRRAFNRQTCTARDLEALKAKFRQIRRMEPDLIKRVREELETAEESTSSEVANYGEVEQESQEQSLQLVHQDDHEEEEWLDPTDVQPATILRPSHRQQPEDLQGMLQQALRELQQVRRTQLREAHRWRAAYRGLTGEVRALRTELRSISCSIQQLVDRNSFPSEATD